MPQSCEISSITLTNRLEEQERQTIRESKVFGNERRLLEKGEVRGWCDVSNGENPRIFVGYRTVDNSGE